MTEFSVFDESFDAVLVEDIVGKIVYFNSSLLSLLKVSPRYFKKNDEADLFFKDIVNKFYPLYLDLKKSSPVLSPEIEFQFEESKNIVIIKGVKVLDYYIYYFKDMTVENNLYAKYKDQVEELKKSHTVILQSDKLKVIGEMTANISHEINNPLTVALGNSEMIEFALEAKELKINEIQRYNTNISNSLTRISKIISNMKEFLHTNEEAKEYYAVIDILKNTLNFLNPLIEKNKIVFDIDTSVAPIVYANRIKLEQVFVNLIQNAIDAMIDSGIDSPKIKIMLGLSDHDGMVNVDFIDNGPGISKENLDKVFQTFFTTKEIGKGTGLGLSISKRIMEAHQGNLEYITIDHGACFRVSLPSITISTYVNGDWEKMHSSESVKKVLVVDNDPNILNLCMSFFKHSNFYFLGATNVKEAITQLNRVKVDYIITDLVMPENSGEDFARAIRAKNTEVPIFYMTSKDKMDQFNKMKNELNLSGIILKPFTKNELIQTLEKYTK